jgi:transcriptional regulator with PAS, ATPase and Fis domain
MRTMAANPRKAAMTPDQLRKAIAASGMNNTQVAKSLEVARTTVIRWLNGSVPISRANARLIREVINPKK